MRSFKWSRKEHLKSSKRISEILKTGKKVTCFPVLFFVVKSPNSDQEHNLQMAFSVSKKRIKKAVGRNRVKRKMFEAARLNRYIFDEKSDLDPCNFEVFALFIGKDVNDADQANAAFQKFFTRVR